VAKRGGEIYSQTPLTMATLKAKLEIINIDQSLLIIVTQRIISSETV
jgi:hypothetical protein